MNEPNDDGHETSNPDPLLDPDRLDLQDPVTILMNLEEATMTTIEKKTGKHGHAQGTPPSPDKLPPIDGATGMTPVEPPRAAPPKEDDPTLPKLKPYEGVELRQRTRPHDVPAWDADEREGNIARALATRDYIEHAGDAASAASASPQAVPVLYNPFTTYLPKLRPLDSMRHYQCHNVIAASLGYAVILALLAQHRNANKASAPEPAADYYAKWSELIEEERRAEHLDEIGYTALPMFNAAEYAGVYMRLVYMQRADIEWGPRMPVMQPHEIIHSLQTGDMGQALAIAYSKIEEQVIGVDNPALANILAAKQRIRQIRSEAEKLVHDQERAYVLTTLQDARPEKFDDGKWDSLPLYIQYRYTTMVYNQIAKAIGNELNRRNHQTDLDKVGRLARMLEHLHLEIEAAARTGEVKAAFELGRLDDRHDIRIKAPEAKPRTPMQRAPAPPPERDFVDDDIPE